MSKINFKQILKDTEPLSPTEGNIHITNIVGIFYILKPPQTICLQSLALALDGLVKYEPKSFPGVVLRIKDCIATTACLVFSSAKIIIVGARTKNHLLYISHVYRQKIESVPSVFRVVNNGLGLYNLIGRTDFQNWDICNIAALYHLKFRPNLKKLIDLVPDLAGWNPELFPGAPFLVWLKPKDQCKCHKKKTKSCKCNCSVLVFDTGKMIIAGCKSIPELNLAIHRIDLFFENEDLRDDQDELAKKDRFENRRRKKMVNYIEFAGWSDKIKKNIGNGEDQEYSMFDRLTSHIKPPTGKKRPLENKEDLDPFIKACKLEQFDNMKFILSYDVSKVNEALDYLYEHVPEINRDIITLLENYS